MNFILSAVTILSLSICGPEKYTIIENQEVIKTTPAVKKETFKFKKVPTKWVKIAKKSN